MMRKFRSSFVLTLLASFLLMSIQRSHHSPSFYVRASSSSTADDENSSIAEYQPTKKKGLKRALDWGLAKIENTFNTLIVSDLITAFITKCDDMFAIMIRSLKEMTTSTYQELHEKEVGRLVRFDTDFRELVKLRNKIDRKCLYASTVEDRSVCVENGIGIQDKIQGLRSQRSKCSDSIERYEEMMEWCASYNNWFC
mmetsp:Transcript_27175/g.56585  ORF Transcript_27175/g.56585 Transcript_27175/m.56585 type:complete len:197 (-) Transcript_27175:181-771(-)|eukprot:CAMPEP_0196152388 /NCGR_PEP_ID=MMETSP0910-20130528/35394_1 /TAXON_ID=49265 /ORGANISM="Thalassiosira rotula, Strain GSO102" /LENGTH=196 /DNA_ID=CAMNT_0041415965 /DNA_START=167 /DNA_END=757 /DNA_ORIENTATION=-